MFNLQRKQELELKLSQIQETYGRRLDPNQEILPKEKTHWDYVIQEMVHSSQQQNKKERAHKFATRRSYFLFQLKRIARNSICMFNNLKSNKEQRQKNEFQKIKKRANELSQMVQRGFWRQVVKVRKYQQYLDTQQRIKQNQQQRLQNLVSEQLKFTNQVASMIQGGEKKEGEESSMDAQSDDSEDAFWDQEIVIILDKKAISDVQFEYKFKCLKKQQKSDKKSLAYLAQIAHEIQAETLNIEGNEKSQPFLIRGQLREYQLVGMNWLLTLQEKRMNGILADEMGLGKTIQTIALLAHMACSKGIWGPHLIIVPTSIIISWEMEFKKWCPAFKILTYFGTQRERKAKRQGWSKLNQFQVCITSYKIALQDQKMFRRKKWYYMILDEAQHIKNFKSQRWQVLLNFNTKHRLLLTGTPLQNDVGELWSLLHFLMPKIFDSHSDFMEWFSLPMQQALQKNLPVSKDILKKLHSILRPFLLRRLKRDVEKQLPTKTEYIIKCPLSRRQKYLYDEFIHRDTTKKSMQQQDFLGLMNIVMQLKKVCNHPDLFESRSVESPFIMDRLKIIIFAHFLIRSQNQYIQILKYEIEGKSSQQIERQQELCPSNQYLNELIQQLQQTRSRDAHFAQRWQKQKIDEKVNNIQKFFNYNKQTIHNSHVIYGSDIIRIFTLYDGEDDLSELYQIKLTQRINQFKKFGKEFMFSVRARASTPELVVTTFNSSFYNYQEECRKILDRPLRQLLIPFHFFHNIQTLSFPNKNLLLYDCGKLNVMVELLKKLKSKGSKALIFTQMSKMLDLFEYVLNLFNFTYVRLDGNTTIENRQRVVQKFNTDPKMFCFIASTRSGGIGLNLTGANTVIFYDTDWNPSMDRQAQDRCHRIGQTRDVSIYRLISEFTIEENILLKSIQKRKLDEYIMEEGEFNTDFYDKVNIKNIFEDVLGIKPGISPSKQDAKQDYEQYLDQVEDKEDVLALKNAFLEQENENMEGMKEIKEIDRDDDPQNPKELDILYEKLPPIFLYGLRFEENEQKEYENLIQNGLMEEERQDQEQTIEGQNLYQNQVSNKQSEEPEELEVEEEGEVGRYENKKANKSSFQVRETRGMRQNSIKDSTFNQSDKEVQYPTTQESHHQSSKESKVHHPSTQEAHHQSSKESKGSCLSVKTFKTRKNVQLPSLKQA